MFTGIVTDVGTVTELDQQGDLRVPGFKTDYDTATVSISAPRSPAMVSA